MFDQFYKFTSLGRTTTMPTIGESLKYTLHFKFATENNSRYFIYVQCYTDSLYIIEFFLRSDLKSKADSKYGKLTNKGNAAKIITTCFRVMIQLLQIDENASFAFMGSPTTKDDQICESLNNTKRFRIYRFVSINLLGEQSFDQFGDEKTSCYLVANKRKDTEFIKYKASEILKSLF